MFSSGNPASYLIRTPFYNSEGVIRLNPVMIFLNRAHIPQIDCNLEVAWIRSQPRSPLQVRRHRHLCDEILFFMGSDPAQPQDLGAEIEYQINDHPLAFSTTSALYLPRAQEHGPRLWRRFHRPHIQISLLIGISERREATEYLPDEPDRVVAVETAPNAAANATTGQYAVHAPLNPPAKKTADGPAADQPAPAAVPATAAAVETAALTYLNPNRIPGVPAALNLEWKNDPATAGTAPPVTIDPDCHRIMLYLGSDPAAPEQLGARLELELQNLPLRFNTSSLLFIPRGYTFRPARCLEQRSPHIEISFRLEPEPAPEI